MHICDRQVQQHAGSTTKTTVFVRVKPFPRSDAEAVTVTLPSKCSGQPISTAQPAAMQIAAAQAMIPKEPSLVTQLGVRIPHYGACSRWIYTDT